MGSMFRPPWSRRSARLFPPNLFGRLVLTKPLERRLTHQIIRRPCSKTDLRHQLRPHPDRPSSCLCGWVLERILRLAQLLQLVAKHSYESFA